MTYATPNERHLRRMHAKANLPEVLREIVELHEPKDWHWNTPVCVQCSDICEAYGYSTYQPWPCPTMQAIFRHHPDLEPE